MIKIIPRIVETRIVVVQEEKIVLELTREEAILVGDLVGITNRLEGHDSYKLYKEFEDRGLTGGFIRDDPGARMPVRMLKKKVTE